MKQVERMGFKARLLQVFSWMRVISTGMSRDARLHVPLTNAPGYLGYQGRHYE
jgi:hypothetical protein